jgi:hypothetical protein
MRRDGASMLTPTHTLYVDEAGSTGIDLTGTVQPFFIAAGYLKGT